MTNAHHKNVQTQQEKSQTGSVSAKGGDIIGKRWEDNKGSQICEGFNPPTHQRNRQEISWPPLVRKNWSHCSWTQTHQDSCENPWMCQKAESQDPEILGLQMTSASKNKKEQSLKKLQEKLTLYELNLYEEAFKLDRKRKTTYIQ